MTPHGEENKMNGKQKLIAATLIGAVIAISVIVGTNALPSIFPGLTSGPSGVLKTGTLILNIKDAPPQAGNLTKLLVTLEPGSVILHRAAENGSENRIRLNMTAQANQEFDLLKLVGDIKTKIGEGSVPTGTYTMIEIHVASAKAAFAGSNNTVSLKVVDDGRLKIPVVFRVVQGQTTEVTVDITLQSTHISASEILRPVIKPIVEHQPEVASSESSTSTTPTTTATTTT